MVSEGVFRGHSNTKAPAVAALSAAAANVILDPILMFALSMGISGAAAATVFAQYLAAFLYGIMLWRGCRGGVMEIPFVSSRLTRKPCKAEASELVETVEGVNAWKLLVSVVSANVAMLIRCVESSVLVSLSRAGLFKIGPALILLCFDLVRFGSFFYLRLKI